MLQVSMYYRKFIFSFPEFLKVKIRVSKDNLNVIPFLLKLFHSLNIFYGWAASMVSHTIKTHQLIYTGVKLFLASPHMVLQPAERTVGKWKTKSVHL